MSATYNNHYLFLYYLLDLEKNHNLKVVSFFFFLVEIFSISSPGDSISINPEKTAPRRRGEEPGYIETL